MQKDSAKAKKNDTSPQAGYNAQVRLVWAYRMLRIYRRYFPQPRMEAQEFLVPPMTQNDE